MDERPPEKRLRVAPFAIHATRGLLRDQKSRRKTMAVLLLIALAMIAVGLVGRGSWLDSREHPLQFIFFWLSCAWMTLSVLLMALLDILLVRAQGRAARKDLRESVKQEDVSGE
jgi:hypothetical protein